MSNPEIEGRFPTIFDIVLAVAAALRHSSPEKHGELRASKAAIEAMPRVTVTAEESDKACSICLEEFEVGGEAREMPCKHKFHSGCIENWLRVKGLCPLCRFVMPLEEEEEGRESMDAVYHQHVEEEGGGRESMDVMDHQQEGGGRESMEHVEEEEGRESIHQHEFWVHFVVVDSNMDSGSDRVEVEVEVEDDDSSTQDMTFNDRN